MFDWIMKSIAPRTVDSLFNIAKFEKELKDIEDANRKSAHEFALVAEKATNMSEAAYNEAQKAVRVLKKIQTLISE